MMPFPSVEGVRLATPDDLDRISLVAAAAFFSSPTFKFQRIDYQKFPSDTIASYFVQYEKAMRDPACVVLIAEDVIDQDESRHVYDALRESFKRVVLSQRGIVGVCSIQLKSESAYTHKFQPPDVFASLYERLGVHDLKRDQSVEAVEIYNAVTRPAKLKHLEGRMRLCTLAVAPFYWQRGHARRLVSFCTQLADLDDALLGVSATPCGATVVLKAGFQERDYIRYTPLTTAQQTRQSNLYSAGFELWIGVRLPSGKFDSGGIVTCSEGSTISSSASATSSV